MRAFYYGVLGTDLTRVELRSAGRSRLLARTEEGGFAAIVRGDLDDGPDRPDLIAAFRGGCDPPRRDRLLRHPRSRLVGCTVLWDLLGPKYARETAVDRRRKRDPGLRVQVRGRIEGARKEPSLIIEFRSPFALAPGERFMYRVMAPQGCGATRRAAAPAWSGPGVRRGSVLRRRIPAPSCNGRYRIEVLFADGDRRRTIGRTTASTDEALPPPG